MNTLEKIEKQDEMQEQLDKRDMVLRYFKQVDYSLKPSKEIYTRIKSKIIALSGINAKTEESYATLCKQAGLDLKEGRDLIKSLFNKELIHMIKRYETPLLNQNVEALYVDKMYTVGVPVPDIALITHEQALDYIVGLIGMGVMLRTFNNIPTIEFKKAVEDVKGLSENDTQRITKVLMTQNRMSMLRLAYTIDEAAAAQGDPKIDLLKNILKYLIENAKNPKNADLLQNLLTDAVNKNPNVHKKFYAGSCEVNDIKYYLFPI